MSDEYPHTRAPRGQPSLAHAIAEGQPLRGGIHFFHLDAHWGEDLSLAEEIDLIFSSGTDAIVMIDDFQVPDDPSYSYDNCGAGKLLSEEYIDGLKSHHQLACFYPADHSLRETGARRGSVVLTRSNRFAYIAQLKSLRQIEK